VACVHGKPLPKGSYELTIVSVAGGLTSAKDKLKFTVTA